MWAGIIQSLEGPNRTKGQRKEDFALSAELLTSMLKGLALQARMCVGQVGALVLSCGLIADW